MPEVSKGGNAREAPLNQLSNIYLKVVQQTPKRRSLRKALILQNPISALALPTNPAVWGLARGSHRTMMHSPMLTKLSGLTTASMVPSEDTILMRVSESEISP